MMRNRSVGGFHLLPSDNVSESVYKEIRSFIDNACFAVDEFYDKHPEYTQTFITTYSISPHLVASILHVIGEKTLFGVYSKDSKSISQEMSAVDLLPLAKPNLTPFSERCSSLLYQALNTDRSYPIPEAILSAWGNVMDFNNTEESRWKNYF